MIKRQRSEGKLFSDVTGNPTHTEYAVKNQRVPSDGPGICNEHGNLRPIYGERGPYMKDGLDRALVQHLKICLATN